MDNMNNLENATAHYCGQCKRKLPLDAFYFNKRRIYYQKKEDTQYVNERTDYPVITRTEDPEKRTELILHAMQVVRASVLQKCKKQREEEAMRE